MTRQRTVLVVDDDAAVRTVLTRALMQAGYEVKTGVNAAAMWEMTAGGEGDVLITDVVLPDAEAFDVLPRIRRRRPELPVIVMSARNNVMTAIRAAERGAFEYVPKPFDLSEMLAAVRRALEARQRPSADDDGEPAGEERLPLIGRSRAMQEVYRVIARLTQTDLTVLIRGESGTGKELVARVLHDYSRRRNGPFVAVNMAAIPRELIESELFGHEKGAFTGAVARHEGCFERARGGTLFLDEIGDMPMEAQTRLLRVLQEGEFVPVGGSRAVRVDVRIIAATHRDLKQLIAAGQFREDLFYRLNVATVRLPPLRERVEDIPDLVAYFIEQAAQEGLPRKHFTPAAMERLRRHGWPGNVRELENLVRRVLAIHADEEIGPDAIDAELAEGVPLVGEVAVDGDLAALEAFMERWLRAHFSRHGNELPPEGLYQRVIHAVERPLIAAALAALNGNQLKTARLLGINRNTLRAHMKALGIDVQRLPRLRNGNASANASGNGAGAAAKGD